MPEKKHGVYELIRTGEWPKKPSGRGLDKLKTALKEIEGSLVEDLGGASQITTGQMMLVKDYVRAQRIVGLAELYINDFGILHPRSISSDKYLDVQPILQRTYVTYLRLSKDILNQLFPDGLARKSEDKMSTLDYIKVIDDKEDEEGSNGEKI